MAEMSNLELQKRENKLLTRTRGPQVTHRPRSTHLSHTQEKATPPTNKGAIVNRLVCQSDETARIAVKRH